MGNILSGVVNNKSKLIRFGVPLIILITIIVIGFLLIFSRTGKLPTTSVFQKKAAVELKTEYKNPFEKNSQYVNPFESYKNPFVVAK